MRNANTQSLDLALALTLCVLIGGAGCARAPIRARMPDDPVLEAARNAAARGDICTARQTYRHLLSRYPVGHDDGENGAMAADHTAVLRLLARLEQGSGNYFEAEVLLLEALDRVERRFGKNDPLTGWIAAELGPLYQSTARLAEAEYFHRRALTLLEPVLEPHDTHLGILLNNLASVLVAADRHGEAIELMERARAFALENADTGSAHAGPLFLVNLADTYRQMGRLVDAEQAYRTALARQRVEKGYRANFIAMTSLDGLAQIEAERGELTTATTLLRAAIGIGERMLEVGNGYCAGMPLYKRTHRRLEIINERYREMRALLHGGWV